MNQSPSAGPSRLLLLATVLVVAANMRPAITVVGPLIQRIGADTGMSAVSLGLLGAAPVFTFAVVSPFVHLLGQRWGIDRVIFLAMAVLTVGTLLRAVPPAPYTLFSGTVLLAAAIGVINVLVPIVVKRDFPGRVPMMTAAYTASLTAVASVASGVAVPLADSIGWQYTLASIALLAVIAAALWSTRICRHNGENHAVTVDNTSQGSLHRDRNVWVSGLAWQVTLFFGFQSSIFYFFLTWMASIHTYQGFSELTAGFSVATFQAVGIIATLVVGRLMQQMEDHRMVTVGLGAGMATGVLGMIIFPTLMPLWAIVCGLTSTATLMVSLTMISLRANSAQQATQLSGMAQGVGYVIGGVLPILAGNLFEATGSWISPLYAALVVITIYTSLGYFCGRNTQIGQHRP